MALTPAKKADGLRYRIRNRAKEAERSRQWRKDNPEKARAQLIAWRLANPEKHKAAEIRNKERKRLKRLLNKKPKKPRIVGVRLSHDLPVVQIWKSQEEWYGI